MTLPGPSARESQCSGPGISSGPISAAARAAASRSGRAAPAATTVTAAITASAVDCGFDRVLMTPATSATQLTTTAITLASGSDRFTCDRVRVFSETSATPPTDILTTTAAVDSFTMADCKFLTAVSSTTNGVINLANAPTNVHLEDCVFDNKKAASTIAAIASASTTGEVAFCSCITQTAGTGAGSFGTIGNLFFNQTFGGQIAKFGVLVGTTST